MEESEVEKIKYILDLSKEYNIFVEEILGNPYFRVTSPNYQLRLRFTPREV